MRAILCNGQCGLIVEALYSTMNLPNPACLFVVAVVVHPTFGCIFVSSVTVLFDGNQI